MLYDVRADLLLVNVGSTSRASIYIQCSLCVAVCTRPWPLYCCGSAQIHEPLQHWQTLWTTTNWHISKCFHKNKCDMHLRCKISPNTLENDWSWDAFALQWQFVEYCSVVFSLCTVLCFLCWFFKTLYVNRMWRIRSDNWSFHLAFHVSC